MFPTFKWVVLVFTPQYLNFIQTSFFNFKNYTVCFLTTLMFRRWESAQQPEGKISELKDAIGRLSGRNLIYCSDACLKRYLEERNWNVEKAKKKVERDAYVAIYV
ncbi:putative CRAL/TRIO domain superfamily, CRAL-TRIO lipid binding domain superfamily [Helianthus annuus]|nr:putative CRAL/TRIO domain superfamily, CRAL-TRIO lipid binding domain superfamily [Helianthus annuus]